MREKNGKHLIVDMDGFGIPPMPDLGQTYELLDKLVKLVKMNALIRPYCMEGAPYNPGVTGFVVIETSHISIHTFTNEQRIALDIYSCMDFDETKVIEFLKEELAPKQLEHTCVRR